MMGEGTFGRKLLWIGGAFGLYALVWYSHVALSAYADPLGAHFDFALWVSASLLKVATTLATLWLLIRVHGAAFGSPTLCRMAFKSWAGATASLVVVLALSRSWWAPLLTSSATKYYYSGDALRLPPDIARHRAAWSGAWSHGFVLGAECLLLAVLALIQAGVALRFGNKPVRSVIAACLLCEAVLGAYLALCPWFLLDYDFFHGDLIAGALLLDQVAVVASDPYTTLTLPFYAALALCHAVILRRAAVTESASPS